MTEFTGGNVKYKILIHAITLMGALTVVANSQANEASGIEYSGSGFMTIGLGKMLGGTRANVSDYDCPCFNADYAQGSIYDGRSGLQWRPDTKIGVQGSASLDNFSLTAQVVARGAHEGSVGIEWLYGSYKVNDNITFQFGRKRLPMFYYSDVQDIGVALPWAHLPPQLYGWEAVNYNGVNVRYQDQFGDWTATMNLLAGNETRKESGYWKVYYGRQNRTDVKWSNLIGGDLLLSKDWLETRFVYIQSDTQTQIVNGTWDPAIPGYDQTMIDASFYPDPPWKQKIYGIALNADYDNWLVRTEYIHINRPGAYWKDYANMVGIGYRYEKWQPMVTYSKYWGAAVMSHPDADPTTLEGHASIALTLRYDLTTSSAVKLQYDDQRDQSEPNYSTNYGDARLLTFTYDTVF